MLFDISGIRAGWGKINKVRISNPMRGLKLTKDRE